MSEPVAQTADEPVNVHVQWHEIARYSATIQMSRADYERLRGKFVGEQDEVEDLECELMTNYNLSRVEANDWDDTEIDVFLEVTPDCGKEFAPGRICVSPQGHKGDCDDFNIPF